MSEQSKDCSKYEVAKNARTNSTDIILNSRGEKKVVVAGAGTGKTHLFKKVLEGKQNTLTLTFINALVEDLSLELYGISEVRTLHGFARSILKKITGKDINISPLLSKIIDEDIKIILNKDIVFEKIFNDLDEHNEYLPFYFARKKYYEYYSYSAIIYASVRFFREHPDKIPGYDQILVDEFQDFNLLEVALIDLLATKSQVMLAGDDDQALYDFKSASPDHIRNRYSEKMPDYASFNLPYCSRCTNVIVGAINDFIDSAKKEGYLINRIDKPYLYFDDEEKDKISLKYPKIGYTQIFTGQLPWFIEKHIDKFANDIKGNFTVLIISPYKIQCTKIAESLKAKGFKNVEYADNEKGEISLLDGYKLLLEDKKCNLGWRVIAKFILTPEEFEILLKETENDYEKKVYDLIGTKHRKTTLKSLSILKEIQKKGEIENDDLTSIFTQLGIDIIQNSKETLKDKIDSTNAQTTNPAIRKIHIKATTIQSSKGLAGDLVFITHFDDTYFIKNDDKSKITDQEICNFLVALTRTKKKAYMISSNEKDPAFLKWISNTKIERINSRVLGSK